MAAGAAANHVVTAERDETGSSDRTIDLQGFVL
jgi:hypothetical protein